MRTLAEYTRLPWTVVVRFHDENGGYWSAAVAELPGCVHSTANRVELLPQLDVLLRVTLDTMLQIGEPIPEPQQPQGSHACQA